MRRKVFIISILLNVYFLITLFYRAPIGFSGGRVIRISDNATASLLSTRDLFGMYCFYELQIIDNDGSIVEECLIRPPTVLPWYELRERKDILAFDEKQKEVVCKLSRFTVRIRIDSNKTVGRKDGSSDKMMFSDTSTPP